MSHLSAVHPSRRPDFFWGMHAVERGADVSMPHFFPSRRERPQAVAPHPGSIEGYHALDLSTSAALAYVQDQITHSLPGLRDRPDAETLRRTVVVVDSACDMPQAWPDYHGIVVVPRAIQTPAGEALETREPTSLNRFHQQLAQLLALAPTTVPTSPIAIRDRIQRHLRRDTTGVVFVTNSARRSNFYGYALAAVQSLVLIHAKVRRAIDPARPMLRAWIADSANALTGCGLLLTEAVRMRETHAPSASIAQGINEFRSAVHTFAVPGSMGDLARSARAIEMRPIARWKQHLAELLGLLPVLHMHMDRVLVSERVRGSLRGRVAVLRRALEHVQREAIATPTIVASYAGPLSDIEELPEFGELRQQCTRQQITLCLSPMSVTGALWLGQGAFSLSLATRRFVH
ncbi:MAG: DegV family protein [Casimicrobiaceae bacterium]|nr:DegV family protein [Casimicrobiaceae bacterium]